MTEYTIRAVEAWEALDSRGRPTVGCRVAVGDGLGRVTVPSGASTGRHEAVELRDGGERYVGYGVRRAVANVREVIAPAILGRPFRDQEELDTTLEGLDEDQLLGGIGANAVLAVSLAALAARADDRGEPLWRHLDGGEVAQIPMPMVNILSGGAHAGQAVDLQDYLAIPVGASSFGEAIEWVDRVRRAAAAALDRAGGRAALVADEGGLAGWLDGNEQALTLLTDAIAAAGFTPGEEVAIALDVAASQLWDGERIVLASESARLSPEEWAARLHDWTTRYPIRSIEDPFGEDDWASWTLFTGAQTGTQIVGDDLFATDRDRLRRGIESRAATAVLVKVNQAGTVTRAARVLADARAAGFATVVSARSGDTEDAWLADLAVGWRAGQIKVGSTMRSERTAKWNRLLELEATTPTEFAGTSGSGPRRG